MANKKHSAAKSKRVSPGRRQYLDFKRKYPDALLLFRIGDFYETFDDDARLLSRTLEITLTSRDVGGGERAPLAGIPHHSLNLYLGKLIKAGLKVAIAEQTSDPKTSKGIVEREVVRVVTPGTVLEADLLNPSVSNYLVAAVTRKARTGVACIDLSTSEFFVMEFGADRLIDELERLNPSEVLTDAESGALLADSRFLLRPVNAASVDFDLAERRVKEHFKVADLEVFGCQDQVQATIAAGLVLEYLCETQFGLLPQITKLRTLSHDNFALLDRHAMRDLEILLPMDGNEKGVSLYNCVNATSTPLGARLLREWLARPLLEVAAINQRQAVVEALFNAPALLKKAMTALKDIGDLERLTNKLRTYAINPRELQATARGLKAAGELKRLLSDGALPLKKIAGQLKPDARVSALIERAVADSPPIALGEGKAIKKGYNAELDELTDLAFNAYRKTLELERKEQNATGLKMLKIGYNKVFGYYVEVTRSGLANIPDRFERKQTLANAERFTTPELKDLEARILSAQSQISELEKRVFAQVCDELNRYADGVMDLARVIARLDVLCGYADCALRNGWVRPTVDNGDEIAVTNGRHPIVENVLDAGRFVPNDIQMSASAEQLLIITGPNMSGKSTFIRMVATLVLLAQVGSYVPAESARIGVADAIFTRTGLSDDITGGRSTFMVEMIEAAAILNRATPRSLVVLDEIGRGTSTYDGLAVAQAMVEYIHNAPHLGCRALFATHYNELIALESALPRVVNYQVAVAEKEQTVHFLRRIVRGGADRSYGVYVARLAGVPAPVIERAWKLLRRFEEMSAPNSKRIQLALSGELAPEPAAPPSPDDKLSQELRQLDLERMTPLEALQKLSDLQKRLAARSDSNSLNRGD